MGIRTRSLVVMAVLAIGTAAIVPSMAHAGCGGGSRGFAFSRVRPTVSSGCGGGCAMNMAGMNMSSMPMTAATPAAAQPAAAPAAGHYYTCPMHPNVASAAPGACPYCHMALTYR